MSTNQTTAGSGRMIDNHRSSQFSPAVIAVIGLLGAAFLLVSYYTMMAKFCTSRDVFRRRIRRRIHVGGAEDRGGGHVDDPGAAHVVHFGQLDGLDQSIIEAIPVLKYGELLEKTSDAKTTLIQDHRRDDTSSKDYDIHAAGTDQPLEQCAVCLSDFQRDESVRLLPLCRHAFHVSCIDMWLRSHSNCPLCRAKIIQDVNQDQPCQQLNNSPVITPRNNDNHGPSASSTPSLISAPEGLRYDSNRFNNSSQGAAPATTATVELAVVIGHDRGAGKSSADAITSSAHPPRAESSSQRSMGMSNMGLRCFSFERPPRIMADDQDLWTVKMKRSSSLTSCPRAWINQMEQAQASIDVLCRNSTLRIHSDRSGIMKQAERGPARQPRLVHNYDGQYNQHPPSSSSSASSSTGTLPRHSFKSRSLNNDVLKNEVINGVTGAVAELAGSTGPGKSNTKATELAGDMAGRSTMLSFKGLRSLSGGRLFGFRAKHSSDIQIWPDPL